MTDGLLRVAAATPAIRVADCAYNAQQIIDLIAQADPDTAVLVFPELCVTGYTCGDLVFQPALLAAAEKALARILEATLSIDAVVLVGTPVAQGASLYNCAAVCQRGRLLGLVPKTHLPTYGEFYEARYFAPADDALMPVRYAEQDTRLGRWQLFACRSLPDFVLGVEVCEDLWAAPQPSERLTMAGATVVANLSASNESMGKMAYRRQLVSLQSGRLTCAYIYANAGEGESTTDLVFAGRSLIAENGVIAAESGGYTTGLLTTEIDLTHLAFDRRRLTTCNNAPAMDTVWFDRPVTPLRLTRPLSPTPFVPTDAAARDACCEDILAIQTAGLCRRLAHTGGGAVLGLSGGLDSALALLVTARAYDKLGRPRDGIRAVTMPCFGTTSRTLGNARALAAACGTTLTEIDITAAVTRHLSDIGHGGAHDVTYENAQARERTQVLMDVANQTGGLVIGTGDLSELALGWATYNGDHMSMYGVNASVPKTLVRHVVAYEARRCGGALGTALTDILDTPVSPELLPPQNGEISQRTEQLVGPYELHDFFLYHLLRYGDRPGKIYRLAQYAFTGRYADEEVKRWLAVFLRRFFAQQYKRSCLPDGPRIGSVALSPRGDWRMPSDASAAVWLAEAGAL